MPKVIWTPSDLYHRHILPNPLHTEVQVLKTLPQADNQIQKGMRRKDKKFLDPRFQP